jgi:hypothetical protein
MEITKPRRNAADLSVPQSEVDEYRDAIIAAGTLAGFQFPDAVSYWHKQQEVHLHAVNFPAANFAAHQSDAFLPWHREFLNQYEVLLREARPRVTLFYWDWLTDPSTNSRLTGLMGNFSGAIGAPFNVLEPPSVSRFLGTYPTAPTPTSVADSTVIGQATFSGHRTQNENPHNRSHTFVGGSGGTLTSPSTSTRDPFFFLLHGNADRLWSMWQRQNSSRFDPATAYSGSSADMISPMAPWNGLRYNGSTASASNPAHSISPWTAADGYIVMKSARDPSVVFPPVYDTAPLTIPALAPGQSVVIEIPWHPPNPADFDCFGPDKGHVCLLARIETSTSAPYGMTFPEGGNVSLNTRNNNNIVWKNVTVEQQMIMAFLWMPIWVRNISLEEVAPARLELRLPEENAALFNFAAVQLELGPELFARWVQNGAVGRGVQRTDGTAVQIVDGFAFLENIPLFPDEVQRVEVQVRLHPDYRDPEGRVFQIDLAQYGAPGQPDELIGGQRFEFDFNKLILVPTASEWCYWDRDEFPGSDWFRLDYDDGNWPCGNAELGYGDGDEATVIHGGERIATWFRHRFHVEDPGFFRNLWLRLKADDGAVVYLNGTEVHRQGMPRGNIAPDTPATEEIEGLAEQVFHPADLSNALPLLREGENILAVAVHQAEKNDADLSFDLELCANVFTPRFPPMAAFIEPVDGSLHLFGRPIQLAAEALHPGGEIASLEFHSDGRLLERISEPPFVLNWENAAAGIHQLTALVTGTDGSIGQAFATVQVLNNLPSVVEITRPAHHAMFAPGEEIPFQVEAIDIGGRIQRVEFFRKPHEPSFDEPEELEGTRTEPPFAITLRNIPPGHHFLTAIATDDEGASTISNPIMIEVMGGAAPVLSIRFAAPFVILEWMPHEALLEQAPTVTGPWNPVADAQSPLELMATGGGMFYRARLP